MPLTQADFTQALKQQLLQAGRPFSRAEVIEFVEDCWALIDLEPTLELWADAF